MIRTISFKTRVTLTFQSMALFNMMTEVLPVYSTWACSSKQQQQKTDPQQEMIDLLLNSRSYNQFAVRFASVQRGRTAGALAWFTKNCEHYDRQPCWSFPTYVFLFCFVCFGKFREVENGECSTRIRKELPIVWSPALLKSVCRQLFVCFDNSRKLERRALFPDSRRTLCSIYLYIFKGDALQRHKFV